MAGRASSTFRIDSTAAPERRAALWRSGADKSGLGGLPCRLASKKISNRRLSLRRIARRAAHLHVHPGDEVRSQWQYAAKRATGHTTVADKTLIGLGGWVPLIMGRKKVRAHASSFLKDYVAAFAGVEVVSAGGGTCLVPAEVAWLVRKPTADSVGWELSGCADGAQDVFQSPDI